MWRPGISPVETARSFFGVHRVADVNDGSARLLYHGTTIHGAQWLRNEDGTAVAGPPAPQTYYYFGGPFAEAISAARAAHGGLDHVAIVGLGTGALACHRKDGEHWTFFEIDPEVIRIARDPHRFQFVSRCAPEAPVVIGDARLTLEASPQRYDLIVLDAFSSDTHSGASSDARGGRGISVETLTAWRDRSAHLQPAPRSRACRGQCRAVARACRLLAGR